MPKMVNFQRHSNGLSQLRNRVLEKAKRLLDTPSLRVSGSLRMKLKD